LICIKANESGLRPIVDLVQCKTSSGLMSKKEKKEFRRYCDSICCYGYIAYRENRKLKFELV
jgi:hypothetical protein